MNPAYNIKQTGDKNKENYQLGDNWLIKHHILCTNIIRIVWLTVRRITNVILEVKGGNHFYYMTQAVRGPITRINQLKCSIAGQHSLCIEPGTFLNGLE